MEQTPGTVVFDSQGGGLKRAISFFISEMGTGQGHDGHAAQATVTVTEPASWESKLLRGLQDVRTNDAKYWDFALRHFPTHSPVYLQYPAMMIPEMQGRLIDLVRAVDPTVKTVGDPFLGSGVILSEAQIRGLDFVGQDINPLAVLLCSVKASRLNQQSLLARSRRVQLRIGSARSTRPAVHFPGVDKWFSKTAILQLSRIRRAIEAEPSKKYRQFFWIALAETIRISSNSRTTTYKLHIRPARERQGRKSSAIANFKRVLHSNILAHGLCQQSLGKAKARVSKVQIRHGDSARAFYGRTLADMVVTSPPYGDNHTTVPYGQFSYLALHWIPKKDLPSADQTLWGNTHSLDTKSLGGSRRLTEGEKTGLKEESGALRNYLHAIQDQPRDRHVRVLAFARDLKRAIPPVLRRSHENAWLIWTVGNRRVGNVPVPLDGMLRDFLEKQGVRTVAQFIRRIPSKRMAARNSTSGTILEETVLIMRRTPSSSTETSHGQ